MTQAELDAYELPPTPLAKGPFPAVIRRGPSEDKDDDLSSPSSEVIGPTHLEHPLVDD